MSVSNVTTSKLWYLSGLNLGYAKTFYINQIETQEHLEPALIREFTKIRSRTEVLACHKHAQSYH
jgi:hypothetical protein